MDLFLKLMKWKLIGIKSNLVKFNFECLDELSFGLIKFNYEFQSSNSHLSKHLSDKTIDTSVEI